MLILLYDFLKLLPKRNYPLTFYQDNLRYSFYFDEMCLFGVYLFEK